MKGSSLTPKPIDADFSEYEKTNGFCISDAVTKTPYQAEITGYRTSYDFYKGAVYCDPFVGLGYMEAERCAEVAKKRTGTNHFQKDEFFYHDSRDNQCALCLEGWKFVKSGGLNVYKITKVPVFNEGEKF